jgi:galactonate dehydratase
MKIKSINTSIAYMGTYNAVFTEIETADGITGQSETSMKRRPQTVKAYIDELSRSLIGQDPRRIEDIAEKLYRDSFWVGGPLHSTGISAVEIALWDIVGKELAVPICRLFGGPTRDRVPVYCHCIAGESPDSFVKNIRQCLERGYKAIKTTLPVFYGASQVADQDMATYSGTSGRVPRSLKETEYLPREVIADIAAYFRAARQEIGWGFEMAVDCHGRLAPDVAVLLCSALEPFNLLFVEEPIPPESPDILRSVKERTLVPIACGEKWATIYGARPFIEMDSISIVQPDVANCGGFGQARRIAALAESHYMGVSIHNPHGPLGTAASLQFAAAIPNFLILETLGARPDWPDMAENPPMVENGTIAVPTKPGLGVSMRKDWIERNPYRPVDGWR